MEKKQETDARTDALQAIDISEEELKVYEVLIEHPGLKAAEIASRSGLSPGRVRQLLGNLEQKSFTSRSPERTPSYRAVTPELAFSARIERYRSGLDAAVAISEQLMKKRIACQSDGADELTVELITGRDALVQTIDGIYRGAKHEVREFDRPPYVNPFPSHMQAHRLMHERGVRCRTLTDVSKYDLVDGAERIQSCVAAGEEIGIYDGVPIKGAIADSRIALVAFHIKDSNEVGLLLRPSLLLDVLCSHFELLWERSVPVHATASQVARPKAEEQEQLVAMLANGFKDRNIADRLKVSDRTLERRISNLQEELGARTRFQAGWRAAMRSLKQC